MLLDKENMFSMSQAVTATAAGANIVDLGPGDAGPSERLSLFVTCDPVFTGTGTITVELLTADALSSGALSSPDTAATYAVTNAALLAGGKLLASRLPHGMKRYAGLKYTVSASATLAGGKITAGLVWDVQADMPDPVTAQ
jgi:hypothetical protein